MKKLLLSSLIAASVGASSLAIAAPKLHLNIEGEGGSNTMTFMLSTELGKVRLNKRTGEYEQKSPNNPYILFDCGITLGKAFKVKDYGSTVRSYKLMDSPVTYKIADKEYGPHMRAGNTTGKVQLLSRNGGKTNEWDLYAKLSEVIHLPYMYVDGDGTASDYPWKANEFGKYAEEVLENGKMHFGSTKPYPGVKATAQCKWVDYFKGMDSYNPSQKVSVSAYFFEDIDANVMGTEAE